MTKKIAALFALLISMPAFANDGEFISPVPAKGPLYTCSMKGTIKGSSVAIIIGGQYIHGPGTIKCRHNVSKKTYSYPVDFRLRGFGVGLDLAKIKKMIVLTAGIGVNNPQHFMKSYAIGASAGAHLIRVGLEFDTAIRVSKNGFGFEVGLQGKEVEGLGAHLYAMGFRIKPRQ